MDAYTTCGARASPWYPGRSTLRAGQAGEHEHKRAQGADQRAGTGGGARVGWARAWARRTVG
eukprot:2985972-Prymnesium_polylepis.1